MPPTDYTISVSRHHRSDQFDVVVGCQTGCLSRADAKRLNDALTEALEAKGPRSELIGKWLITEVPPEALIASDEKDCQQWRVRINYDDGQSICIMRHILPATTDGFLRDELWNRAKSIATAANAQNVKW